MLTPIFGTLGTWAIAALAVMALMGISFVKGMTYEGNKQLAEQAKIEAARKEIVRVVNRDVTKIEYRYIEKKAKADANALAANQEVINHAKLPDPVSCWLLPERVSTIAKAWGVGPSADPGKQADPVQGTGQGLPSTKDRKPQ